MEEITSTSWRRLDTPNDLPEKRHHTLSLVGTSLVAYGGAVNGTPVADLLVLKNWKSGWEKKVWGGTISPPPLWHHNAVEFGLRLYIIGGRTPSGTNNDIFVYNQVTNVWIKARQLGDMLPQPRSSQASAAIARIIYVFGGISDGGALLGDFWSYSTDTNFWAPLPAIGISARRGHSCTVVRSVLYIFGGTTSHGLSNEIHSWSPQTSTWTKHQTVGHVPPPTSGHVAWAVGRHLYILGGETPGGPQREVFALDTDNFAWQRMSAMSNVCCARSGHALTYNANEHIAFVTGGATESLGFTQPTFETFARRVEVLIAAPFVPTHEDAAITRAQTLISIPKTTKLSPGTATASRASISPSPVRPATPASVPVLSADNTRVSPATPSQTSPSARASQSTDTERKSHSVSRKGGSRIGKTTRDDIPDISASQGRASTPGTPTINASGTSSAGFFSFGSLKKKLNPGPGAAAGEDKSGEEDESNQEDESADATGSHIQDDKSGNNAASTKEALEALPAEMKALLTDLEAEPEPVIRAILPMSKDYFITKKLRTYHHVFTGTDAVSFLEKSFMIPKQACVLYFQRLMEAGWFVRVPQEGPFQAGSSHHYQLLDKALSLRPSAVVLHASDDDKKKTDDDEKKRKKTADEEEKKRHTEQKEKEKDDDKEAKEKKKDDDKEAKEKKKHDDDEEKKRKEEERRKRREKKEKPAAPEPEISITGPTAVIYSSKEAQPAPTVAPKPAPKQKTEEEVHETEEQISKKNAHRQEVLKELIATEKDYIRDLSIIVNLYMEPLQNEQKTLIKPNEFAAVFSTINMLPPLNQELVGKLEKTKELPPADQVVGTVFLEMHPYFKLYMGYCTNHAASLSTLKKLKNNAQFAAFIEEVRQKPECRKLDIEAYLIKPLQRICRYPLLLKEIYKDMPHKHKDRASLADSIDKIEQVVREVNEAKRLAEHLNQVVEIQNSFVFPDATTEIVTSSRRLIREAQIKKVTNGLMSETSDRIIFLFNDLLLLGTEKLGKNIGLGKKYQFKAMHPIETIIVWDVKDGDGGKHIKNAFTIVRTDKKDKQTYMVGTKEEKDQLVAQINECIINIPNLGKDKKDTREVREAAFAAFKKTLA